MTTGLPVKRLAILSYHKIGAPPRGGRDTVYYIPVEVFRRQLVWLHQSGWSILDAAAMLDGLATPERAPARGVLVTFDDGYRSTVELVLPLLEEFDVPAICFVPTAHVGGRNAWDDGFEPEEPLCTWSELRELAHRGVAVESHGVSHAWLSLADDEEREREIVASKRALEDLIGARVELFAFPYGDAGGVHERDVEARLAHAGYRAAFLCGGDPTLETLPVRRPYRLNRIFMHRDSDLDRELGTPPRA